MKKYSDIELIQGCQQGILEYQEALYKLYFSDFMKLCHRYLPNDDEASIALNDSFLKIFKSIVNYELTGSFYSWMKRIVVNSCLDLLKSKAYRKQKNTYEIMDFDVGQSNRGIEKDLISSQNYEQLLSFIRDLERMERIVFNLYVFEDYSHREIAEMMSFSENTSSWYLHKARKKLKERIVKSKMYIHLN